MEKCCFLIHGQNSSDYFSDSVKKRTRSLQKKQKGGLFQWNGWVNMQFNDWCNLVNG